MVSGVERKVIAFSIVTTACIVLVHAVSVLLRKSLAPDVAAFAYPVVWATVIVMLLSLGMSVFRHSGKFRIVIPSGISLLTYGLFVIMDSNLLVPLAAVPAVCPIAVLSANWVAGYLPERLDGVSRRYPIRSILWVFLALLMLAQTARLSSWVTDPTEEWWLSTTDPFFEPLFTQHMCMVAYVYAADLNRQGVDNVYDWSHYPGLNPDAEVHTTIKNFAPDDPYQYPPQFLVLPRLAIALTDDFDLIKIFWLFIQVAVFVSIAFSVVRFVGGDRAIMAIFLIPALWISFPVLANWQYGQFHMMSILLGIAAMMWFMEGKYLIGGSALSLAMLSKIAPGILLIYLISRKRWKEVGWTLGCCAAFSLIAVAIIGTKPFIAFLNYQLPNLQNGSAFAFAEVWPDVRDFIIAGNQSPFAFIFKLDALGLPGMTWAVARFTHMIYVLSVIAFAVIAARLSGGRTKQFLIWLALLNLATMISKGAWGDYIPIGTLWAMTFMIKELSSTLRQKVIAAIIGIFMFFSLGVLPIQGLGNPTVFISLAAIGMLITIGFNIWILFGHKVEAEADSLVIETDASTT
jgi:hypothetical protein